VSTTLPTHHAGDEPEPFRRKNLAAFVGGIIVLLGLALNSGTIRWLAYPTDIVPSGSRRAVVVLLFQGLLVLLGALLLVRRPRITIVHLCAMGVVGFAGSLIGILLLQLLYVPTPILSGWRTTAPASERNQLSFRGRPISYSPSDYVVVLLGDSQVEAMALPYEKMPERLLESELSSSDRAVKVFSVGTGGYGQDQELLALEEYLQTYRADLVVLWPTPRNDVWNNVFASHMGNNNPKPTFWLENGQLRGPNERLGQQLADSRFIVAAMWQRIVTLRRRDKVWDERLPEPYVPLTAAGGPVNQEWQTNWNTNRGGWMRYENLDTERSHFSVTLTPPSKRMEYGLQLTHALVARIQDMTKSKGGELVVLQVEEPADSKPIDGVYVLNGKYYQVSKRQLDENWRTATDGFDREAIPLTVHDWRVSEDDGHLNREANEQVMRDLAQRLRCRTSGRPGCEPGQPHQELTLSRTAYK
jgi:hypothetical protein